MFTLSAEGPFSTFLLLFTERPLSTGSTVLLLLTERLFSTVLVLLKEGPAIFYSLSSVNGGTGHFLQSVVLLTERPAILSSFSSVNGREGPFSTVLVLLTERPFSKDSAVLVLLTEEPFSTVCESTPVMMLLDNVLTRPRLFQRISLACTCIGLHHPLARRRFPSRHLKNI